MWRVLVEGIRIVVILDMLLLKIRLVVVLRRRNVKVGPVVMVLIGVTPRWRLR